MQVDSTLVTYAYEASSYGGSHNPNVVVIHDVECPLKRGYARSLIGPAWFGGPAGTSTHYLVGPDDICQGVPESRIAWHCGTGNPRTLAIEQTGYASNSATDWDTPEGLVQQENVSKLLADINRRRPLIRLRILSDSELLYAWNNPGTPGGVATHNQMSRVIRGTTHYDPFNSPNSSIAYPLQRVVNRAVAIRGGSPDPGPSPTPTPIEEDEDNDMYHTYQPTAGPDSGGVWIACPGFFDVIPSMEYYNALVLSGAAKPVKAVSQREFDVIRDSYRRFKAPETTAKDVWDYNGIPSYWSDPDGGVTQPAYAMLGWTNKAAEQAAANTAPKA